MMLSSVDLPTPSGPISPTMQPAGSVDRDRVERHRAAVALRDVLEARDWRRMPARLIARGHLAVAACSRGGHVAAGIGQDVSDAGQPAAHDLGTAAQPIGIDPHADAEHQLVALGLGLDRFGRELRLRGDER